MRGKAVSNYWGNDSVYVQFSRSVDVTGAPIHRIGSAMSTTLTIEEASNAGLSQWGWADNAYGGFAGPIYFETAGTQTIRVQVREDGLSIDQIVLGGATYLLASPGAARNDSTILERTGGTSRTVVLYTADDSRGPEPVKGEKLELVGAATELHITNILKHRINNRFMF